jgi:hypothetical protein
MAKKKTTKKTGKKRRRESIAEIKDRRSRHAAAMARCRERQENAEIPLFPFDLGDEDTTRYAIDNAIWRALMQYATHPRANTKLPAEAMKLAMEWTAMKGAVPGAAVITGERRADGRVELDTPAQGHPLAEVCRDLVSQPYVGDGPLPGFQAAQTDAPLPPEDEDDDDDDCDED